MQVGGILMFISLGGSFFIMPICYHPTTVLAIDDDKVFLKIFSTEMSDKLPLLCFDKPEEAIKYMKNEHHYLPFTSRCLIETEDGITLNFVTIRNEIYNADRFKEICIIMTDYDMPHITGIELVKTMKLPPEISQYSHIILTGKISSEFKEKLAKLGSKIEYIGKNDPQYITKLLALIKKREDSIFQWMSYVSARILSNNIKEKTSFLFDGNFAEIFNSYIKEHNICECYLIDKQGSYLFLDGQANLSWLFIRNETGIENTIQLAKKYGAPTSVVDALKTKTVILSLYEKEDFERRKIIDWDKYLLPATIFESDDEYLRFFPNLIPTSNHGKTIHPKYYYIFVNDFPEHGIDKSKILSYQAYLQNVALES